MELRPMKIRKITFDGASARSQAPLQIWTCSDCSRNFGVRSWLAYLDENNEFAFVDDPRFAAAYTEAVTRKVMPWSNHFENERGLKKRLVCAFCASKLHKEEYVHVGPKTGQLSTTPRFDKARKRTEGKPTKSSTMHTLKQLDNLLEQQVVVRDDMPKVRAQDAFLKIERHEASKKGRDWVTPIGPIASQHYGCWLCHSNPSRSNSWYRCVRMGIEVREGQTETDGYWLCARCGKRWTWRVSGNKRLFVMGSKEMMDQGIYFFAHSGAVDSDNENLLNYLKSLVLLQALDGKKITTGAVLAAIDELNSMVERKLHRGVRELKTIQACDIDRDTYQLYCESRSLSMDREGLVFKTIDLSEIHGTVETFDNEHLTEFLHLCGAFMNVENSWPSEPASRQARNKMAHSPTFSVHAAAYSRSCRR